MDRGTLPDRAVAQLTRLRSLTSRLRGVAHRRLRQWRRKRLAHSRLRSRRTFALLGGLVLLAVALATALSFLAPHPPGQRMTLDRIQAYAAAHRIVAAEFDDEDANLVATVTSGRATKTPPRAAPVVVWSAYPKSDTETAALLQQVTGSGARVAVDHQTAKGNVRILAMYVVPLLILADVFALLFGSGKGAGSAIGEVEMFGSIGHGRLAGRRRRQLGFADVAGVDQAVVELREVRDYLADPDRYRDIGARPPKGVLLIGPPGCGKTLLAKAVAGEVGIPFFSVAGAEFVESLVGVGAARVRDLFRRVRAVAPAIVFIDELDAAGRRRGGAGEGGSDEREQTLNQLLVEMDGFDVTSGIVVIAATNRPDILDPALLRPGRFDRHVTVDRPDVSGRSRILALHAAGKPLAYDVDLDAVARRTPGFSGADLANVVNEAALFAARVGKQEITMDDFDEAVQRVVAGSIRQVRMLGPEERRRAAVHEGGHVIVAAAAGQGDAIQRVSILGREHVVAATTMRADEETEFLTEDHLAERLALLLAGRAAERLVFGQTSTGSERDLVVATDLARDMVARYGMSERLGPVRLLARDADEYLDADVPLSTVSGATHQDLDSEVRRLIEEAEASALARLSTHRDALDALSDRLEAEETLEETDLAPLLSSVAPRVQVLGMSLPPDDGDEPAVAPAPRRERSR